MEASILFGLEFSPKDTAYSGREVVLKTHRFAPKKNTNLSTGANVIKLFVSFRPKGEITLVAPRYVISPASK